MAVFSVSKFLNRMEEIPTCVPVNSVDPRVSLFSKCEFWHTEVRFLGHVV